jgi:hypothetical protein
MLIDPDFLDHWRTRALVDLLDGDELAPLYLIRLWSHCQTRRADTFEIPTAGLKALCRYAGDANRLESALIEAGWVERDGRNLRACKWLQKNSGMFARWENGKSGGRPKKPTDNLSETGQEPAANQHRTSGEPIREEKRREEKKREKTNTPADAGSGSFDAWWAMYPVRGPGIPRGNKRKAWAGWVMLSHGERAEVVEATRRLIKSGTYPKDAERFLKGSKGADPPYKAFLDDTPVSVVSGASKPTAAQVKESRNYEYDSSWLDEFGSKGDKA